MTNNYVKNIAKNIIEKSAKIEKLIKAVFPDFEISNVDYKPISPRVKAIVATIKNEENEELTIFFSDFECLYGFNKKFKYNEKKLDKLNLLFLEEMVKTFAGTNYIIDLENDYNEKLKRGFELLKSDEEIDKKAIKKEMKQAIKEIKYLKKLAEKHTLER